MSQCCFIFSPFKKDWLWLLFLCVLFSIVFLLLLLLLSLRSMVLSAEESLFCPDLLWLFLLLLLFELVASETADAYLLELFSKRPCGVYVDVWKGCFELSLACCSVDFMSPGLRISCCL